MKILQFEQPCTPDVLQLKYAEVLRRAGDELGSAIERGEIRSPIDKVFPLEETAQALARMNANEHFGKIVLLLDD